MTLPRGCCLKPSKKTLQTATATATLVMSPKRQTEGGGKTGTDGSGADEKRRRVPTFESVVVDMMKMRSVQHLLEPILEPLIRKVVKEEVELALKKHMNSMKRSYGKELHPSICRHLHLQFINSISLPVFTGARIEADDCSSLKVALIDIPTGQIITTGPESLAKIEIVVLEGDFDGDESNHWTTQEFRHNIVREREGKKPLLTGEAVLNLKDGIGLLGEISFSDNSSWTRSRRFRLGARALDCFDGIRIKEAKTEPFIVRDHRGELYKKHHPPSLLDEVWRLEKIGKDGAFHKRLIRENINTVKDFLTVLFLDPARLRNILGTGMSAKMWEVTVEHARTCVLDKRVYLYCLPQSHLKSGVVFNVVGQVMGVLSECQYVPIDKLADPEKMESHNLVISAYQHWEEVVSFDEESSLTGASSCPASTLCNAISSKTEGSNSSRFLSSDRLTGGFDYTQPSSSSPDIISSIYSTGDVVSGLEEYSLPSIENMSLRYDHGLTLPVPMGQVGSSLICSTVPIGHDFFDEDHLQFFDSDYILPPQTPNFEPQTDLQCAVDNFLLRRSVVSSANAKRRWRKVFSVLKWLSIRKLVSRRTRAQIRVNPERWHVNHVIPSRIMAEVSAPGLVRY